MNFILRLCLLIGMAASFFFPAFAEEGLSVTAVFPYSLSAGSDGSVPAGSTQLLYLSAESANVPYERSAHVTVTLPEGFSIERDDRWTGEGPVAETDWTLPADYGQCFAILSVHVPESAVEGSYTARVRLEGDGWEEEKQISFTVVPAAPVSEEEKETAVASKKGPSWYVQNAALPVDRDGRRDDRQEQGTLYVRDVTLENIRSRLTGGGAVNWAEVFSEPVTYVLLDLRNPRRDQRSLHFKAELTNSVTGDVMAGLVPAPQGDGENSPRDDSHATEALISLNGAPMQQVVLPLYADPFAASEGEYRLRMEIWDQEGTKTVEVPVTVVRKKSAGLLSVGFAALSLLIVLLSFSRWKRCILRIGARGDIATALFASLAFGGVVVPVTLLGDFLQVILGPFSGLATGLLSGVLMYILLFSLLMLFRHPGVAGLFFLIKWLLSGILFGRFTPVGILSTAVYVVIVEGVLLASGFYRARSISPLRAAVTALLLGVSDAAITMINMEQLMFFYRLYYADWFIALYMVVNGLLYSSFGSYLGWHIGRRLEQVMGE